MSRHHERIHRAVLETLESRRLLKAAIVVNTTDDETVANATTSLREAITIAQTNAGDDEIDFDPAVFTPGSLHTILMTGEQDLSGVNGKISIVGPGADVLNISGHDLHRVFLLNSPVNAIFSGMTISHGSVQITGGAGIVNFGMLSLSGVVMSDNTLTGVNGAAGDTQVGGGVGGSVAGAAIDNFNFLTVDDCTFSGNVATGGNGGDAEAGGGAGGAVRGGAIYTQGGLSVTNSLFQNNSVTGGRAGHHIGGDANTASGDALGGDIGVGVALPLATIAHCTFTGTKATGGKGADANGTFAAGPGGDAEGGSIYSDSINLQISQCTFSNITATGGDGGDGDAPGTGGAGGEAHGGTLYSEGTATLSDIAFITSTAQGGSPGVKSGNPGGGRARGGGAYNSGTMHLTDVGFSKAAAFGGPTLGATPAGDAQGGAIVNVGSGKLDMTGCEFELSTAVGGESPSGTPGKAFGGAIYSENQIVIDSCKIHDSDAVGGHGDNETFGHAGQESQGGGLYLSGPISASIRNSAIYNNFADGGDGSNASGGAGGNGGIAAGGGIYAIAPLTLVNSTVYGNHAVGGAGGSGTTFGGNGERGHGGGIEMVNTTLLTVNVTVAANVAEGGAAGSGPTPGTVGNGIAGGIVNGDTTLLISTIVADNQAVSEGPDLEGDFTLVHSLVSAPAVDYAALATSHDNKLNTPADLGPLIDNGGFTPTALPNEMSPAIDAGDNDAAIDASLTFDQRGDGFPRIVNNVVDMGAVETPLPPFSVLTLIGNGQTIPEDDTTPSSLDFTDFGTAKVGTPIDRTFTIRNDGNADLNVGFIILPVGFSVLTPFTSPVSPGNTTNFTIRFDPGLPGAFGGNVEMSNNTGAGGTLGHFDFTIAGTALSAAGNAFRVNFQPAAAEVPSGYLLDAGSVFGSRGNGYSYGWNASASSFTRDRNAVADQAFDTLVHTQLYGVRTWEISVPNGTYSVHLVAGDASFFDSVYKVNVEGVLVANGTPTSGNRFVQGTKNVTVTDGKLTITNAAGSVNNKLDFIEVTPAAAPPPPTIKINFEPSGAAVPGGYLADTGSVFGSRGNGQSYGWNLGASTFARDRNVLSDQARDTLIHTQLYGVRSWELAVPNGSYSVHLVAGDPSFFDSVYKFNAEGTLVLSGTPTSGSRFVEGTKTVTVSDGRLTIANAAGSVNNKIDFIEVTPL